MENSITEKKVDISVILVNYKTIDLVKQCILSIFLHVRDVSYEIIVVDNDSNDNCVQLLSKIFPTVTFIQAGANLGFGRANNLGVQHAKGRYLFFLNSDTLLLNNVFPYYLISIENTLSPKLDNPGVLGSLLLDGNGNVTHSYGTFPTLHGVLKDEALRLIRLRGLMNARKSVSAANLPKKVDYVTGANMFMPKEVFDSVGGFYPKFFMYFEETDLQYRLSNRNFHSYVVNGPKIIHLEGRSYKKNQRRRCNFARSLFLYLSRHNSSFKLFCFRYLYFLLRCSSLLKPGYTFKEHKEYMKIILKT